MTHTRKLFLLVAVVLACTGCGSNNSEDETTTELDPANYFSADQYEEVSSGSYTGSQIQKYQNDELFEYTNNLYNEAGKIKYTCTYDSSDNAIYWAESSFDDNGNEVNKKVAESGGMYDYIYEYEYDSSNRLVKQTEYDNQEQILGITEWEYEGLTTREISYTSAGNESQTTETTVDEDNRPISVIISYQDEIESETYYKYDENGFPVEYTIDNDKCTYENTFDVNGNLINCVTYKNGKEESTSTFTYNEEGQNLTYDYHDTSDIDISFTYEYDAAGNQTLARNITTGESTSSTYNSDNVVVDYKVIVADSSVTYEEKTFFYKDSDKQIQLVYTTQCKK